MGLLPHTIYAGNSKHSSRDTLVPSFGVGFSGMRAFLLVSRRSAGASEPARRVRQCASVAVVVVHRFSFSLHNMGFLLVPLHHFIQFSY